MIAVELNDIQSLLKTNPDQALKWLYDQYYSYVCMVIFKMINDGNKAEDIAQEVFLEVWKRRETLEINSSLKGYIRKIAVNKTLNFIRSNKMKFEEDDGLAHIEDAQPQIQKTLEAEDLQKKINQAIELLPEKCRVVFAMSRFEELSYREISEKLQISVKTVENQVSKALKLLRQKVLLEPN